MKPSKSRNAVRAQEKITTEDTEKVIVIKIKTQRKKKIISHMDAGISKSEKRSRFLKKSGGLGCELSDLCVCMRGTVGSKIKITLCAPCLEKVVGYGRAN